METTKDKLSKENKEDIKNAGDKISSLFVWDKTKSGHKYWENVEKKLKELSEQKHKCEHKCEVHK